MIQPSRVRNRSEGAEVWPRLTVATRSTWMACCSTRAGLLKATAVLSKAPSDLFRTKDGWILALAIGNPMFRRWAKLMGEDHWLTDPRFKDDIARGDNSEIISKRMSEWSASRTTKEALAELEAAKIPSAPLYSPQQALDDAHIRTAGLLRDTEYPGVARGVPLAPTPVDLSETPGRFQRRAPTLGEHTDEILSELGYQKTQIAELRTRNVI